MREQLPKKRQGTATTHRSPTNLNVCKFESEDKCEDDVTLHIIVSRNKDDGGADGDANCADQDCDNTKYKQDI